MTGGLRIGSLFSGIGGLELGLEWAGVGHTVWQVELDPFCRSGLARHWPNAERFSDVREVGARNLAPVDVICGGFPCQDISYAGKGEGLQGSRSGLWFEFARIIGEMGPDLVVVENVRALLTRGIDAILGTLADLGYDAEWHMLSAAAVGAPHKRERIFILAYARRGSVQRLDDANSTSGEHRTDEGEGLQRERRGRDVGTGGDGLGMAYANSALEHTVTNDRGRQLEAKGTGIGRTGLAGTGKGLDDTERSRLEGHSWDDGTAGRRTRPGGSPTASGLSLGWRDAVPMRGADGKVRLIPREAAEGGPQSPLWPVAHGIPGRVARLRAIGNAVVPQCAYVVGQRLLEIAKARHESFERLPPNALTRGSGVGDHAGL